jgi:hypothetical protein
MVPDIGKTNSGRDAAGPSQSTEEGGLGYAETPAALEHVACTIMFREIERSVRIVNDSIADSQIELDGDFNRLGTSADALPCIILDALVIAVNHGCWIQIKQKFFFHLLTPLILE